MRTQKKSCRDRERERVESGPQPSGISEFAIATDPMVRFIHDDDFDFRIIINDTSLEKRVFFFVYGTEPSN